MSEAIIMNVVEMLSSFGFLDDEALATGISLLDNEEEVSL